jgi:hypothetical protein
MPKTIREAVSELTDLLKQASDNAAVQLSDGKIPDTEIALLTVLAEGLVKAGVEMPRANKRLRALLKTAQDALQSYAYGNSSPDLAIEVNKQIQEASDAN